MRLTGKCLPTARRKSSVDSCEVHAIDPTDGPVAQVLEALRAGEEAPRPVVVGPVTYLLLIEDRKSVV